LIHFYKRNKEHPVINVIYFNAKLRV